MRYFLDTEFIERGAEHPIDLISIAVVAEDGREYYAENSEADLSKASEWVQENVVTHLWSRRPDKAEANKWSRDGGSGGYLNRRIIAADLRTFVTGDRPEFWADYADYDWVVFAQIFGTMMDLPEGFPMYCNDIQQWRFNLGSPELPQQTGTAHNALDDARYCKQLWEFLNTYSRRDV